MLLWNIITYTVSLCLQCCLLSQIPLMLKKKASHKGVNTMRDFGNHIQVCLHSQICLFLKLGDGAVKNWGEQWPCLWWPCFGVSCGSSCVWDGLQDTGGFARFITVHAQYFSCVQFFETPQTSAPPGSSVHGIFQARILEWVAISFSRDLSNPGIEPVSPKSPASQEYSLPLSHWGSTGIITDTCAYQQGQQYCYRNAVQCYLGCGFHYKTSLVFVHLITYFSSLLTYV